MGCQPKSKSQSFYKAKSVELAKALVRRQGFCDWCGAVPKLMPNKKGQLRMKPQLQGAHIFPEEYFQTCADPYNIIVLCSGCHKFKRSAWHKSPLEAADWFHSKYPMRYAELKEKVNTITQVDWQETYSQLLERKKTLEA
jgi:hypothetical protein